MSEAKTHKREVRAVWEAVRRDRKERSKLATAVDLAESAERLEAHAAALKALAEGMAEPEAPPAEDAEPASETKAKGKAKRERSRSKKPKKS